MNFSRSGRQRRCRHAPFVAVLLLAGFSLCAACSGATAEDAPTDEELCATFCERWHNDGCSKPGEYMAALEDITQFSGCAPQSCADFIASVSEPYQRLYRCLMTSPLECNTGEPPRIEGCDTEAIAAADSFRSCELLPSLDPGDCPEDAPKRHYCSLKVAEHLEDAFWPVESSGCTDNGGGFYCCDPGWATMAPK